MRRPRPAMLRTFAGRRGEGIGVDRLDQAAVDDAGRTHQPLPQDHGTGDAARAVP